MEAKHRVKTGGAGLGAICALALVCVWGLAGSAFAQASPASNTASSGDSSATKTSSAKPATTTAQAKTSAAGTSTTSKAKAHAASHPATGTHPKSNTAGIAHNSKVKRASARSKKKTTARGQQKIDPERAQAIQEALIREHYLSGEAAGSWNQASEDAMRKYQADHGWQSKTVPDSRALISLGLGPSHDHLLNPESAMTTGPVALHTASANSASSSPVSHSAEPGTRINTSPALPTDPSGATTSPNHDGTGPQ
ncbi:MAG: hypothetical protein WAM78_11100 [Candidatus Sulfotelmatobacter sp.]